MDTLRMPGSFYQELDDSQLWQTSTNRNRPPLRKRPRIATEPTENPHAAPSQTLDHPSTTFDLASPSPLANTSYRLAGGLDTPGAKEAEYRDYTDDLDGEQDYRPNRCNLMRRADTCENSSLQTPSGEASTDWGFATTARFLVGKLYNFCLKTPFSGFSAGAGPSYSLDIGTPEVSNRGMTTNVSKERDVFSRHYVAEFIPGSFQEELQEECMTRRIHTPLTPKQSYQHRSGDDSMVKGNWVFVERCDDDDEMNSPARKRSKASTASSISRRQPSQKGSLAVTSSASYASPRSRTSSTAFSQPRRSLVNSSSLRTNSNDGAQRKRVRSSVGPLHKRQSSSGTLASSPISPEIESYQKQKRKQDRKQDESLRRLNEQLQDMIREGKEALGAKIELIDDDNHHSDEGYFEDGR